MTELKLDNKNRNEREQTCPLLTGISFGASSFAVSAPTAALSVYSQTTKSFSMSLRLKLPSLFSENPSIYEKLDIYYYKVETTVYQSEHINLEKILIIHWKYKSYCLWKKVSFAKEMVIFVIQFISK